MDFLESESVVIFRLIRVGLLEALTQRLRPDFGVNMHNNKIKSSLANAFLVRGVDLWNTTGVRRQVDIYVEHGVVKDISDHALNAVRPGVRVLEGNGLVVLPAGVDAQVHLRVPGQSHKETPVSGLWAAVAGGVGALLTMPNTNPVLDEVSVLDLARREVEGPSAETGVTVLFSAAMTKGQKGRECVDFESLAKAGVSAFTDDGVGVADSAVMESIMSRVAPTGLPILQHAEVPGHGGVLAEGPIQTLVGGIAYPDNAEIEMVQRDIKLLQRYPEVRYHVLHVSAAKTIDVVSEARRMGLNVSCEVSPHHLFFTSDDIDQGNSAFKMNPPIRSRSDRDHLREALRSGACDFMATDHAPHEAAVKTTNFKTSAFGTTGLETSLRVMIWLWRHGLLSVERLVEAWSSAPARFLNVDNTYGSIAVGRPFQAVLVDVNAPEQIVSPDDFVGLARNSCFTNTRLPGRIVATILGARIHNLL